MPGAMIAVEHLQVSYRTVRAVEDVSFTLGPGEILAVVGPNGSGKTSTLECVEGLRRPDGGTVAVFGKDPWRHRRDIYRDMGVQLQDTAYPAKIRVAELCRLFASFYQRPADWELLLNQLDLADKRRQPVKKLSGGERQRLSILLSLMARPKLLLLDELTTGLDPEVRQGIWRSLRQIRDGGVAVVMVSHYLDEVEALADRLVYMEQGRSLFCGTQAAFRDYVRSRLPAQTAGEGLSLEQLYLLLTPQTAGITMEGIR